MSSKFWGKQRKEDEDDDEELDEESEEESSEGSEEESDDKEKSGDDDEKDDDEESSSDDSSSDDSSSSDDDDSDDDDAEDEEAERKKGEQAAKQKKIDDEYDDEEEDEDEDRVVRNPRDKSLISLKKAWDSMTSMLLAGQSVKAEMITQSPEEIFKETDFSLSDWKGITDKFKDINKLLEKHQKEVENKVPALYLRAMRTLNFAINKFSGEKDVVKTMNKIQYTAFMSLSRRIKAHMAPYLAGIETLPAIPTVEELPSDYVISSKVKSKAASQAAAGTEAKPEGENDEDEDEDDDDDEQWDDDDSSSSDDDEEFKQLTGRDRWVKRTIQKPSYEDQQKEAQERAKKLAEKIAQKEKLKAEAAAAAQAKAARSADEEQELTPQELKNMVLITVAQIWRRDGSRHELLNKLRSLASRSLAFGPKSSVPAFMQLISVQLNANRGIDDFMPVNEWKQVCRDMKFVIGQLLDDPKLVLRQDDPTAMEAALLNATAGKKEAAPENAAEDEKDANAIYVIGDLAVFVGRIAEEFSKHLRNIDPHLRDYIVRLGDEGTLVELCRMVYVLKQREGDNFNASQLALLAVEHLYYMHESVATPILQAQARAKVLGDPNFYHPASLGSSHATESAIPADARENPQFAHPASFMGTPGSASFKGQIPDVMDVGKFIDTSCMFIYEHGDDRAKARAILCQVYHHALHDRFFQARDLLLMSRLQDSVHNADIPTQILFNRMMIQLGMSAFRAGYIAEAHNCLAELCSFGRAKDLLGQGMPRFRGQQPFDRDSDFERQMRRLLVPFHLHINIELLECVHLTCAMFLEIPNMVLTDSGIANISRHHRYISIISPHFRRLLENQERQTFIGPPEDARDNVLAAARALKEGDWKEASKYLLDNIEIWKLIPTFPTVKAMLVQKLKEESLRTYLITYCSHYDSIRQEVLCSLFDLSPREIQSLTTKMIMKDELRGSWDQPTKTFILHKIEPTHLQALALRLSDTCGKFVDQNERNLGKLTGTYSTKDDERGAGGFGKKFQGRNREDRGAGGERGRGGNNGGQQRPFARRGTGARRGRGGGIYRPKR